MVFGFGVAVSASSRRLSNIIFQQNSLLAKEYQEGLGLLHSRRLLFGQIAIIDNGRLAMTRTIFSFQPQPIVYTAMKLPASSHNYLQNLSVTARLFHLSKPDYKEINYEEFLNLKKKGLTVVDVRNNDEISQSGTISGSINIPLQHIPKAFGKTEDYFKAKLGKKRPNENQMIMFLCKSGMRSKNAMDTARSLFSSKNNTKMPSVDEEFRHLDYNQLIELKSKERNTVLIDVREKHELEQTGVLPDSHHIPLLEINQALTLQDNEFEASYNFPKPHPQDHVVFSCRSGRRSMVALEKALAQGFINAKHYKGGWIDWEQKTAEPKEPPVNKS